MSKFVISKRTNDEFQFNLKADNGQVVLTSEGYTIKASCEKGIESVRTNASTDSNYERKKSTNKKDYFTLKAANNQIIGTSEMYESTSGMETGIASVKKNASLAIIED